MNICGCLVHVIPARADAAVEQMAEIVGVEIHARAEDGRIVVVVEDTPQRLASETIMALHQVPGVVSLTLTYHHFEDLADPRERRVSSQPDQASRSTAPWPSQNPAGPS